MFCRFDFFGLDDTHVMALSQGPLADALESYQQLAWPHYLSSNMPSQIDDMETLLPIPAALSLDDLLLC
jgi:hypothetical protein